VPADVPSISKCYGHQQSRPYGYHDAYSPTDRPALYAKPRACQTSHLGNTPRRPLSVDLGQQRTLKVLDAHSMGVDPKFEVLDLALEPARGRESYSMRNLTPAVSSSCDIKTNRVHPDSMYSHTGRDTTEKRVVIETVAATMDSSQRYSPARM
jgi:hypothetical protein